MPRVVIVVGNPEPRSRTREAAERLEDPLSAWIEHNRAALPQSLRFDSRAGGRA